MLRNPPDPSNPWRAQGLTRGGTPARIAVLLAVFACLFANPAAAQDAEEGGTVFAVTRAWFAAEAALARHIQNPANPASGEAVSEALGRTAAAVDAFKEGYIYRAYLLSSFSHKNQIGNISALLDKIKTAIMEKRPQDAARGAAALRDALIEWQKSDMEMMNRIQLAYLSQNMIFVIAIMCLALYLACMLRMSRQIRQRERQATAYSRAMMGAQEKERSRIAQELHDAVIPELRHLGFLSYAKNARQDAQALFGAGCDALIRRIRDICQALIPPDFSRLGFVESLRGLCSAFESEGGITCRFAAAEGMDFSALSEERQLHCFRIIQEALANAGKHSGAAEASVLIRQEKRRSSGRKKAGKVFLIICVTDDGRGFNTRAAAAGLGIPGMYNRAALLGGKLSLESGENAGVMVHLEIPCGEARI
ncbi:MAG: hypothetical protein LBT33_01185 [Spirochaetia bacterium]|nr:hypothetical protein [Spirochaetia bacterium]